MLVALLLLTVITMSMTIICLLLLHKLYNELLDTRLDIDETHGLLCDMAIEDAWDELLEEREAAL